MFAALLCVALSAQVEVQKTFTLKAAVPDVVNWLAVHRDDLSASTRWTVVGRSGDMVRLVRSTPRGTFDITVRERLFRIGDTAYYSTELVHCHRGQVLAQTVRASVSPSGTGCRITVSAFANVGGRVSDFDVRVGMNTALRGFERYIESRFR